GMASNSCAGSSPARGTKPDGAHQVFFCLAEFLTVMYYVYILKSVSTDRYYVGYSELPEGNASGFSFEEVMFSAAHRFSHQNHASVLLTFVIKPACYVNRQIPAQLNPGHYPYCCSLLYGVKERRSQQ